MAQGFYEMLGVDRDASGEEVAQAYQRKLAELVRGLRAARKQGADVTVLEAQERSLRESMAVLSDPSRRRRYDAFRRATERGMPADADQLWEQVKDAMTDPAAAAALDAVRATTDLALDGVALGREGALGGEVAPASNRVLPPLAQGSAVEPEPAPPARARARPAPPATPPAAGEASEPTPGPAVRVAPGPTVSPAPRLEKDDPARIAERFGHDGRFLRAVRESRGLGLEDLSKSTRISLRYLQAIEENGFDRLPAATFVRGYLKEIARVLRMDDPAVVDGYMALFTHHRG